MSLTGASAAVRVRISDQSLLGDLREYLETAECSVRDLGKGILHVSMPRARSDDQALREIAIYLRA